MNESQIKTQKFIIKYFTEIMIKGSTAKRQMISQVYNNLVNILSKISKDIKVKKFFDKIEVVCPIEVVVEVRLKLLDTPGIQQILEAMQFDDMNTLDDIKVKVNEMMAHEIQGKSFVIRCKRTGTQEFKSTQVEQTVGGYMLAMNDTKGVALKNAEVTINIELVFAQLNIITLKHMGMGGFPIGSQGSILSLMSGGFDSTVAYLWNKFGSSHRVQFISVPFDDVVTEIFKSVSEPYMGVMLKRLMLIASEKIADTMKIDALVTGESVAQVSSQTLRNLALIDQATNKLVLRPLAMMSKPDIIEIANNIGTSRFAESMPEYCGVISKNPVTHGNYDRIASEARRFDYTVLDEAVRTSVFVNVDEIAQDVSEIGQMEVVSDLSSGDYTVIDIRQSADCIETSCETLKIPFYKLKSEFKKLPQDKQYLFYCDKGILSQLHAQFLRDAENYTNIKVYRP